MASTLDVGSVNRPRLLSRSSPSSDHDRMPESSTSSSFVRAVFSRPSHDSLSTSVTKLVALAPDESPKRGSSFEMSTNRVGSVPVQSHQERAAASMVDLDRTWQPRRVMRSPVMHRMLPRWSTDAKNVIAASDNALSTGLGPHFPPGPVSLLMSSKAAGEPGAGPPSEVLDVMENHIACSLDRVGEAH
jgi:hypothetical protein